MDYADTLNNARNFLCFANTESCPNCEATFLKDYIYSKWKSIPITYVQKKKGSIAFASNQSKGGDKIVQKTTQLSFENNCGRYVSIILGLFIFEVKKSIWGWNNILLLLNNISEEDPLTYGELLAQYYSAISINATLSQYGIIAIPDRFPLLNTIMQHNRTNNKATFVQNKKSVQEYIQGLIELIPKDYIKHINFDNYQRPLRELYFSFGKYDPAYVGSFLHILTQDCGFTPTPGTIELRNKLSQMISDQLTNEEKKLVTSKILNILASRLTTFLYKVGDVMVTLLIDNASFNESARVQYQTIIRAVNLTLQNPDQSMMAAVHHAFLPSDVIDELSSPVPRKAQ